MKKIILIAVIAVIIGLTVSQGWLSFLSFEELKSQQNGLQAYQQANPVKTILYFALIYVAITALSLPGAAILTLAGGAIFGLWSGLIIVSFASTLGATLAMLAARFLLSDWVRSRFSAQIKPIDEGIRKEGALYLFALRLVPVFPFFAINALMGLTRIQVMTFWWVSQIGMLAGTFVYVNAGTQLAQIATPADILSPKLLIAFALLGIFPLIARKALHLIKAKQVYKKWHKPAQFDTNLLVIGAGSGGLVSAYIAAAVKAKVILVEKHQMGGDCLNTGCVPSKAIIRSARLAQEMRDADRYGLSPIEPDIHFDTVMQRVHQVIAQVEPHDSVERYSDLGVDVRQGTATLKSPWEVEIKYPNGEIETVYAKNIILATGASPRIPTLPGLEQIDYLTSDTLWGLNTLPKRLIVLGGGPIGCELSQSFQRLGSQVTQIEHGSRLMPREDEDASQAVMQKMRAEGVSIRCNHKAESIVIREGEKILITRNNQNDIVEFAFDELLIAIGRVPRLQGYGLEELGLIQENAQTLETDQYLQTIFPNIFACGDLVGPYQLTHAASHQAWHASVNALFGNLKSFAVNYQYLPWATFTDPEVARVGLNEQDAKAQGIPYEVTMYGIDDLDRAIADSHDYGFVKVLTQPGKDKILGVTLVGSHAGDLIAEFVLAMKHGLGLNKILGTIHIYPTMTEANKFAAGNWKKAHAPAQVLKWLERYHQWRL